MILCHPKAQLESSGRRQKGSFLDETDDLSPQPKFYVSDFSFTLLFRLTYDLAEDIEKWLTVYPRTRSVILRDSFPALSQSEKQLNSSRDVRQQSLITLMQLNITIVCRCDSPQKILIRTQLIGIR